MTKIIMHIDEDSSDIFFDCLDHAGDSGVCHMVSAIVNVLVSASLRADCEPTHYSSGHVRLDIPAAKPETIEVFESAMGPLQHLADECPDLLRIY